MTGSLLGQPYSGREAVSIGLKSRDFEAKVEVFQN